MECIRDRGRTFGLHANNARNARQPAKLIQILEAFMNARDNVAIPDRDKDCQRRMFHVYANLFMPFLMRFLPPLPNLEGGGLLTFRSDRIVSRVAAIPSKLVRSMDGLVK